MPAYLDHAASTPLRPAAFEAMLPWLTERCGNPSGAHREARAARRALDDARDVLAELLGAGPGDVIFTSGGTEADNLALLGAAPALAAAAGPAPGPGGRGTVVASAVEHHAVLEPVAHAGGRLVPVDAQGRVDLEALAAALGPDVRVVSVLLVNNEIGTVAPLGDIAEVVRRRAPGALLHTDAVQGLTWLDLAERTAAADLVSLSAHKFGGPKGVGVLLARPGVALTPRQLGGGQERGRRSGTQDVAGVAGMAAAAAEAAATRAETVGRVTALRNRLLDGLAARLTGWRPTVQLDWPPAATPAPAIAGAAVGGAVGPRGVAGPAAAAPPGAVPEPEVAPGIVNLVVEGVESEALLFLLDEQGVCASAGSSCSSGAVQLSHVLAALGVRPDEGGALRLSLGWSSTEADVDEAVGVLVRSVERLRSHR